MGSSTVVVAGARIGRGTYLSDHVLVRETAVIGEEVMIGRGAVITHNAPVGEMVALRGTEVTRVSLEEALREPKLLDPALYETAEVFFG